jgi:hypothetical protein
VQVIDSPAWPSRPWLSRPLLNEARDLGGKAFEPSTPTLATSQDRRDETRQFSAPDYDPFTERFDTPDRRGARALLEQLG